MIKTGSYISDKSISLCEDTPFPNISCGVLVDNCRIQDEESETCSKQSEAQKQQKPPLKRGISRIKSDPKILPVANSFLSKIS